MPVHLTLEVRVWYTSYDLLLTSWGREVLQAIITVERVYWLSQMLFSCIYHLPTFINVGICQQQISLLPLPKPYKIAFLIPYTTMEFYS